MTLLRSGEVLHSRYQILEYSGEAALYIAYRARDLQGPGDEKQADTLLKVVRAELAHDQPSRSYLLRELLRVRGLSHPGLTRPAEVMLADEQRCVLLAEPINPGLSQGVSLHRLFSYRRREQERFSLDEVRKLGVQVAPTLAYIHGQSLCHGDLRLEAMMVRPDGVRLCDVGIGRALPRGPYLDAVRQTGELDLLAPEVVAGRPPDARSDVFSLAALYRHLLSLGERPAWDAFGTEKPALSMVLKRSLSDNPDQRHQTVEELVAELEAVALIGGPLRRRPAPTPLAMAVAAGRLPPEELNRPVEELVPESGRRRRNSGAFDVGAVLMPLSSSPSGRVSVGSLPPSARSVPSSARSIPPSGSSPAAARAASGVAPQDASAGESGSSGREARLSAPALARRGRRPLGATEGEDVGGMQTRPVTKVDLDEIQRALAPASPPPAGAASDIGGMYTTPFTRLAADPAEALQVALAATPPQPVSKSADSPLRAGLAGSSAQQPEPADQTPDQTIEQSRLDASDLLEPLAAPIAAVRLDPGDLPTNAFERIPDSEVSSAPPRRPPEPIDFRALDSAHSEPPPARVADEVLPMATTPLVPIVVSGHFPRAQPAAPTQRTMTMPSGRPVRVAQRAPSRMVVLAALVISAVIGALTAVGMVSLFRGPRHHSSPGVPSVPSVPAPAPAPILVRPPPPRVPAPAPPSRAPTPTAPSAVAALPATAALKVPAPAVAGAACAAGMVPFPFAAASLCIDRYEYPGAGQLPLTGVSAGEAEAACRKRGARLCSPDEWEAACRGRNRASYPYGPDPRSDVCNTTGAQVSAAGAHPRCVSASGAVDMAGNAAEWVKGAGVRGGSAAGETDGRCSRWLKTPPTGRSPVIGFRCCH